MVTAVNVVLVNMNKEKKFFLPTVLCCWQFFCTIFISILSHNLFPHRLMYRSVIKLNLAIFIYKYSIKSEEEVMSLIKEAKEKNPDAFDQLMQKQLQRMYRIAISMLNNEEDAADAIQETVLKCWQKMGQLKKEEYFQTWLTRILINQCKDILKARKRFVPMEEIPEESYEDDYFTEEWKSLLQVLDVKYRLVMELYYVEGYSTKEIAEMLHITDANARSRLTRGRRQLEQYISANSIA